MSFWDEMKEHDDGDNTLGSLIILPSLLSQLNHRVDGYKPKLVKATEGTGCYSFSKLDAKLPNDDSVQRVIWMPWLDEHVVGARRYVYENMRTVNYFMTSQLSGCRITLTDDVILHVANKPSKCLGRDSRDRDIAEAKALAGMNAGGHIRRLSSTTPSIFAGFSGFPGSSTSSSSSGFSRTAGTDYNYADTYRSNVFGYRTARGWVYRALIQTAGSSAGRWITL